MTSLSTDGLTGAQKEQVMEQLKQQLAVASAQELLSKMTKKCFQKCIEIPTRSLSSYEKTCLEFCMDRYMESWNLVSKTYSSRILREKEKM